MAELYIAISITITLIAKLIIYIKCRKEKDKCYKKKCPLRHWCEKYDYRREVIEWLNDGTSK